MPQLAPLTDEGLSEAARKLLIDLKGKLGVVPNMYRTLAHAPQVLEAALVMGRAIRTDLDGKLRELVYLKVAQICACHV